MLTDRQERFCQEYLIDLNATQAYIRAGYSARTAHNCASRLMAKAGVRARIDELMAVRSRRTGVTQDIDFECAGLREDAKADDRAALMSVRVKSGDDFTEREVRLYDKVRALELLGKHLGMFTEKVELSGERVRIVDDVPEAARDG